MRAIGPPGRFAARRGREKHMGWREVSPKRFRARVGECPRTGCWGLARAGLVLLRQVAADLGRREAEAAQLDLVPGLEAAGVAVEVEDRRLDGVGVLALDRAQAAAAGGALDAQPGAVRQDSISLVVEVAGQDQRDLAVDLAGGRRARGRRRCPRGCRRCSGRAGRWRGGRPPVPRPRRRRADCERSGVNWGSPMPAKRRPAIVSALPSSRTCDVLQVLQVALGDHGSRGCRGPRRRGRRGPRWGPGSRSRRRCRGPSCRRSRRSR